MPIPPTHRGAAEAAQLLRSVAVAAEMLAIHPQTPALRRAARDHLRKLGLSGSSMRTAIRVIQIARADGMIRSRAAIRFDGRMDDHAAIIDALTLAMDIELDESRRRGIAYCLSATVASITR